MQDCVRGPTSSGSVSLGRRGETLTSTRRSYDRDPAEYSSKVQQRRRHSAMFSGVRTCLLSLNDAQRDPCRHLVASFWVDGVFAEDFAGVLVDDGDGVGVGEDGHGRAGDNGVPGLAQTHDAFTVPYPGTSMEIHGETGAIVIGDSMTQDTPGTLPLYGDTSDALYHINIRAFAAAAQGDGRPHGSRNVDGILVTMP